jgi:hypothetical protein
VLHREGSERPEARASPAAPLIIPKVMKLTTLADVRALIRHLPQHTREKETWHHVAARLAEATRGGDVADDQPARAGNQLQ